MLDCRKGRHDVVLSGESRWVTTTDFGRSWEIIVEPDDELETLVVVTAYATE
jgi:hypothetical protein